ncbi:LuxR family transcriptional regulator [Tsukamurella asaccharolytica]|uniref:LuxR family transcriptional regulator n=1 Tax=Tsukamurella asaccharolytica TaxID=2592067 RepID=A0A5C5RB93_9ACTN|nr:LuxR C-terminal-related transcriptional regulator [Tsukamurella asaccharolytica]TWS20397.1 LuxR family transcriptional regulator [Tsukamurella asaccharolytica]
MRGVSRAGRTRYRGTPPVDTVEPIELEVGMSGAVLSAVGLTDREVEVVRAWLRTDSKAAAAGRLFIAECTVAEHVTRVRAKYAAAGRPAATKAALAARLLQDDYVRLDEL